MPEQLKRGNDHIFFIGFLGAGKSTLARNLGRMFGRRYVDLDRLVERKNGASIGKLFKRDGEEHFRVLETRALRDLGQERSLLVSCGGGVVETPANIELMHQMGYCVYLDGDFSDSLRHIHSTVARPDFKNPKHARKLYYHRKPLYEAAADLTIDIRGKSFKGVAYECAQVLVERGLL